MFRCKVAKWEDNDKARVEAYNEVSLAFPGRPAGFRLFDLQCLYGEFWHVMNCINTVHDRHK